jgi:hypothetical protein
VVLFSVSRNGPTLGWRQHLVEFTRVVLGSLVFTPIGFLLVGLLRSQEPRWILDPKRFVIDPSAYLTVNVSLVFRTIIIEAVIVLALVWFYDSSRAVILDKKFTKTHQWESLFGNLPVQPFTPNKWVRKLICFPLVRKTILTSRRILGFRPVEIPSGVESDSVFRSIALVTLRSQEQLLGHVELYSLVEVPNDREFLLMPVTENDVKALPPKFQAVAQNPGSIFWKKLYIPMHAVDKIEMEYVNFEKSNLKTRADGRLR